MVDLVLMIGLPGSGKSTLIASWQQTYPGLLLISSDAIRAQLFGDESIQGSWLLVWNEIQRQLRQAVTAIAQGQAQAALYDATNAVRRHRRGAIATARHIGFTHITGVWLDTPLPLCLERNQRRDRQVPDDVILRMHRRLTGAPPSLPEGLNRLIRYSAPTSHVPGNKAPWLHSGFRTSKENQSIPPVSQDVRLWW
ncbi:AAA family ATPase [Oculatella sp. LEGE 06141]|uniref:AAA family ATPase n=1 Tax=Oculatella sp. LEGE 06141 TaxID=1828648 RepID=UPI001882BCF7|nr:AAA family ATPase [Oculatella sp. LEGE 06141]MBE9181023.1 AAA family ATPase [Oculatella sp. LEGE 06141]